LSYCFKAVIIGYKQNTFMHKILLVEDDTFLTDIYTTKLKSESFQVSCAADGEEALEKIKEESFDLVLLDIILPKIDGWEVLRKIKESEKNKNSKVIIISNSEEIIEKDHEVLGVAASLVKAEFTPQETVEKIREVIEED